MFKAFFQSIGSYYSALVLIHRQGWWVYVVVPGLVSLLFGVLLLSAATGAGLHLGAWVGRVYPYTFGKEYVAAIAATVAVYLLWMLAFVVYRAAVLVLVTPWLTAISVRTERHVLGSRYEPSNRTLWQSLIRSVRIGLRLAWWQLLFTAIFSLVAFVPVVGQVAGVMLFAIDSYYAGFGNYDYYLDRHYNYATSVRWVNAHRSAAFGNGLAFMLLLLVPVIGIALAPTLGVVAATLHALGEKEAKAV